MQSEQLKNENRSSVLMSYALVYLVMVLILPRAGIMEGFLLRLFQCLSYLLLGISGILIFRNDFLNGCKLWKNQFMKNLIWLIAAFIGGMILQNLASIPAYLLGSEAIGGNTEAVSAAFKTLPFPVLILSLGVLGPITEELIFRLIMIDRGSDKFPGTLCIILSSFAFMLVHLKTLDLVGLANVLPILGMALPYGIAYYKTKNITIPVFFHVMNNSLALLLMIE